MTRPYLSFCSIATAGATLVFALACSSDLGPRASGPCTGDVSMSITSSLSPTVSWEPACALSVLVIRPTAFGDPSNDRVVWDVATYGKNIVQPPLHFGVDPFAGVRGDTLPAASAAMPLVGGRTYQVTLFRAAVDGSGQGFAAAQLAFTPPLPPRSSAQDPLPGTYIQLPPPGKTFPYDSNDRMIGIVHADTLTIFSDLTYQATGSWPDPSTATPRSAFTRVGADSLYFPHIASGMFDMYARVHGDTLAFEADTVSVLPQSTTYVRR